MSAHNALRRSTRRVMHAALAAALALLARPAVAQFVTSAGAFVASPTDGHTPRSIVGLTAMVKLANLGVRASIGESGRDVVEGWDTTHITYAWTADADVVVGQPATLSGVLFEPYAFAGLGVGRWDPTHMAQRRGNYSTGAGITIGARRGVQFSFETRRRRMWEPYVVNGIASSTLTEGRLALSFAFGGRGETPPRR